MIALLLAISLLRAPAAPPARWGEEILCWPDSGACAPRVVTLGASQKAWEEEILCWPDSGACAPRVVNLGSWNPIPDDYTPAPFELCAGCSLPAPVTVPPLSPGPINFAE